MRKRVWLTSFDYIGEHRYSLTLCTHGRQRLFIDKEFVDVVLSQFVRTADEEYFALPAYCFMPDHLHLLVEGVLPRSDLRRFVARAKQRSGYVGKQRLGIHLWQRYSWDRVLRSQQMTLTVTRYILENPVRAGLVANPLDFPFSGSMVYTREQLAEAWR